jgi:hypothetical protein
MLVAQIASVNGAAVELPASFVAVEPPPAKGNVLKDSQLD